MATPTKTPASERHRRLPRMRTNVVAAETPDGVHHCLYIGPSADEALRIYGLLRERGGQFCRPTGNADTLQASRAILTLDLKASKHCGFSP